MTMLEAIKDNHCVAIEFVKKNEKKCWTITFSEATNLCSFFNNLVGDVEYVGEPTPEKPYDYFKRLFVEEELIPCVDCASA